MQMQQFLLKVEKRENMQYALTVQQRPHAMRDERKKRIVGDSATIDGLRLVSSWDLILDILRDNKVKPSAIHRDRKSPLTLSEASGVRLLLLFKAIAPMSSLDHIRSVQQGVWAMSDEEAYYWFSKCHGLNARRALQALRILCGGAE